MGLRERLEEDLKKAMRERDVSRRSVLRLIRSEVHNEEIALQRHLDDDGIVGVISRQLRQRRESIYEFHKGQREDLVQREEKELVILQEYLPQQLTAEEIMVLVQGVIRETGSKGLGDKGKVMGRLMPQVKGKAEGLAVNEVVTKLLEAL
ncbi:GatB/YqeY domain-containing protein [SAR202 cluster bacterium AC-647-N09_OGT_505m]|nr:GatB/YqeY domain-containing protein [SAR202 cluster bacterium AC-647-N09_OGT_505m]